MNNNAKKLEAFVSAAHDYYMDNTKKTFEELRDYQRSDWGDGLAGDEWASIDDAAEAGIDAAQQYIESERLTADQVITRAALVSSRHYVHTDTGSVMTGLEWMEQIRSAYPDLDSAFDPAGDGAHLVEIESPAASLGRKGGQAKTPAKAAAAKRRANVGLAAGRKALAALTPEQRSENARKAAKARWAKKKGE